MNVLVTGIDGFVGSHLAELLLKIPGIKLFGLVKSDSPTPLIDHLRSRIEFLKADITDAHAVDDAVAASKPDRIFHLAGQAFVPLSLRAPDETFRVNINGGINLLEAARSQKSSAVIIIVSSGEVYGSPEDISKPINESFPLHPGNPYAASKACIDLIAQQYGRSFGMNVIVARPFNHLGPRQSELFVGSAFAKQIAEMKSGRRDRTIHVGNLEAKRDFTDVRDVARAYYLLTERVSNSGVFNICSGSSIRIREILNLLCEMSGFEVSIHQDPDRIRVNDTMDIHGNADRLRAVTGWKPSIPLRDTLRDLLAYWEERIERERMIPDSRAVPH